MRVLADGDGGRLIVGVALAALFVNASACRRESAPPAAPVAAYGTYPHAPYGGHPSGHWQTPPGGMYPGPQPGGTYPGPQSQPQPQVGPACGPYEIIIPPGFSFPSTPAGELPWPFDPKYWPQLPRVVPQPAPAPPSPGPSPSPVPPAPGPGPAPVPSEASAYEQRVLDLVNQRRARGARCGGESFGPAPPLSGMPVLFQASRAHSQDMAQRGYFSHSSPEGAGPTERAQRAGFSGGGVAENIAAGGMTPEETVEQWMSSPGHCGNIMMPRYKTTGVGYAYTTARYQHYWTQMFGM